MGKNPDQQKITQTFANSAGYLLSQSSRLYRERLEEVLKSLHLSLYEYGSLRLISLNTPMSQGVLGSRYGIDRTTMVAVIDKLEERGMVTRERSETDRRSYRLLLTTKGKKILSRALRAVTKEQQKFLAPISAAEWETVRDCLWRMIEAQHQSDAALKPKAPEKAARKRGSF